MRNVIKTAALILLALPAWAQDPEPPPEGEAAKPEGTFLELPMVEKATIGGQVRVRGEYKDPVDYRLPGTYGRPADQEVEDADEILLLRSRLHLDLDLKHDISAFLQIQDSRIFGQEGGVTGNTDTTDLHQGWVRFSNLLDQPLEVTVGRIELPSLGDARLVSALDWHNMARSWDGVAATWSPSDFWIYASSAIIRESPSTGNGDQYFHALYGSYRGVERHEFDAYLFVRDYRDEPVIGEDGLAGDLTDVTAGVRLKGAFSGFDYTGEAIFQTGDYANDEISSHALAGTLGYTFEHDWKPRLGIEVTVASGDEDPADGDRETFDPLFSFAHAYHGYYDIAHWKNMHTFMATARVKPEEWLTLQVDFHVFHLEENRDGWYSVPVGATIRRDPTGGSANRIGKEIDVHAKIKVNEHLAFWLGYARFMAASYVERTGPDPDGDWFFCNMTVSF